MGYLPMRVRGWDPAIVNTLVRKSKSRGEKESLRGGNWTTFQRELQPLTRFHQALWVMAGRSQV